MAEYIDKARFLEYTRSDPVGRILCERYNLDGAIEAFPTADVAEIVRCKDCRWFDMTDPCGTIAPNSHRCKRVTRLWMEDDAFCAYGERRDENGTTD